MCCFVRVHRFMVRQLLLTEAAEAATDTANTVSPRNISGFIIMLLLHIYWKSQIDHDYTTF